jgi:hypothetical protein
MAAIAYRRGYGWSLPPLTTRAGRPGDGRVVENQIKVFSSKGLSAPGTLGTSPLPQIGTPIPGTNLVYIRPRLSQDELGGYDGTVFPYAYYAWPGTDGRYVRARGVMDRRSVTYTNPEYSFYRENQRTPSIGMAGAMSMGRTMDVPFQSDAPWFVWPPSP